jgi:RNA 2',3'-cyclic 3'-phosphodiesterase
MRSMPPADTAELRLFLALWPDAPVLEQLVTLADSWAWPEQARRTAPAKLHVTLHFIGNVPAARLPDLRAGLEVEWSGCDLAFDRATVWPGGIAVLEASRVPAPLAQLHADLAEELRELGLPVESRPYRPHVTLARKAFAARPPAFDPLRWRAGPGYALVRSVGGGRGYETLQSFG